MYGWLWRVLPGPAAVRVLLLAVAAAALVVLLFEVVFPAVAPLVPVNDGTVDAAVRVPTPDDLGAAGTDRGPAFQEPRDRRGVEGALGGWAA